MNDLGKKRGGDTIALGPSAIHFAISQPIRYNLRIGE